MTAGLETYRELAEASWRWVLAQVRYSDGPWVPSTVTDPPEDEPPWDRDGMHSGVGGLALVLAEIRACRAWSEQESALADAIADRIRRAIPTMTDVTLFDGLVSAIGTLSALQAPGADLAVGRIAELATDDGWPQTAIGPPRYTPDARVNDLTLGTAGVLLGATWVLDSVPAARGLAAHAVDVLAAEAEDLPTGANWPFVPARFCAEASTRQMPNLSHGLAGIVLALALAGERLGRADATELATRGAEHLVTLADTGGDGFVVPRTIPPAADMDEVTYTWCHGPTGTSLAFGALEHAGVETLASRSPGEWRRRCLHSVRTSGVPQRLRPGFWDNDGRCCGTAGVGEVFLDSWHRTGDGDDLAFAIVLGDALGARAVVDGDRACWRFVEHRNDDPLLPPGVGWMQGAAGISAFLFHLSRAVDLGAGAAAVPRLDNWWAT